MASMHHAHINVWEDGKLIPHISEHTSDFDLSIVDHNYLADDIGKAVVRAINYTRTYGLDVTHCRYGVEIRRS